MRENGWPVFLLGAFAFPLGIATGSVWVGMVALLASFVGSGVRAARTPDRLQALLPDPAPAGQFRAVVEYRRGGLATGRDEMALTVVDGWLVGEGVRSNFALRSADVREGRMWDERMDRRERLLLVDGSEIRLRGIAFDAAAKATLDAWRRSSAAGEPTFPPARAHEQEAVRWGAWALTGSSLISLPNLVAALLHLGPKFAETRSAVAVAGFLVAGWSWRSIARLLAFTTEARQSEAVAGQAVTTASDLECGDSSPPSSGASAPCLLVDSEEARRRSGWVERR